MYNLYFYNILLLNCKLIKIFLECKLKHPYSFEECPSFQEHQLKRQDDLHFIFVVHFDIISKREEQVCFCGGVGVGIPARIFLMVAPPFPITYGINSPSAVT